MANYNEPKPDDAVGGQMASPKNAGIIWEGGSDRFYSLLHGIAVSRIQF